jgi:cysteine desulfurase
MASAEPDLIYLDHAATAPLDPVARAAMLPWLGDRFGNPSASYRLGREAQAAIDDARAKVAAVLNVRESEVVFTSGGSESVNAAVRGIASAARLARTGRQIVTTAIEHHAVLHTCQSLELFGFEVTYVPPDDLGRVAVEAVARAIGPETCLVSVMLANNETGTIQPVAEIARAVRERAAALGKVVPVHTDAVQAPGWLPVDARAIGVDALSLSAHKFGGPKGVGILYLRRGVPFLSQLTGGGQERQRRAGTENVAGIVGAGVALERAEARRPVACALVAPLRDQLEAELIAHVPDVWRNGDPDGRLPATLNLGFGGLRGEDLVLALDADDVAASSGSACANTTWEPSHVLIAMGQTQEKAAAAVRFSLGHATSAAEVERVVAAVVRSAERVRADAAATVHR